jgi:hypothetical protein
MLAPNYQPLGRWLAAGLGAGLISFCALPAAQADLHLAIGSRLEPLRYTSAYFPTYNTGAERPPALDGDTSSSFQSTSLNPYLALYFAQRYGIVASLDIAYAKSAADTQAMNATMPTSTNNSYFQFGISIGGKAYLNTPTSGKVSPYVYADLFKYFASVSTDDPSVTGEQASARAALRSPIGATLAFGAEYFVSPSFSIGSEIFGFRVSNVSNDYRDGMPGNQTHHDASYTQVAFYTGLTLNYRFQVAASVRSSDDENEDRGSRRRSGGEYQPPPPTPAAPPPPPPTPEAVD